jgi:hypothetical protein
MVRKAACRGLAVMGLALLNVSAGAGQASLDRDTTAGPGLQASGTFAPSGPPHAPPVRVSAGGSCVVELTQAYVITGTLAGSLEIDYRILVYGPCEVPPVLGKYDETWIARGTFSGALDGSAASGTLTYTAQVRAGGDVDGRMVFGDGMDGELVVAGNFGDGELSYSGWVK